MKEIVDKTGLSKGAFYHYFESKEFFLRRLLIIYCLHRCLLTLICILKSSLYEFYHACATNSNLYKEIEA